MSQFEIRNILDILLERGEISPSTIQVIERYVETWECTPFEALIECNIFSESDLADLLAQILKCDRIYYVGSLNIAKDALEALPFEHARQWTCLPVRFQDGAKESLEVVVADPTREDHLKVLRKLLNCDFVLAVGERTDILVAVDELYPLEKQIPSLTQDD